MTSVRHGAQLLLLTLAAAVALPVAPAAAHTELLGASVAAGAVVPADTAEVVLSFSGRVREQLSAVVVTGPSGDGTDGPLSLRGNDIVQPLDAPLAPGTWTLSYRVVAADGHPISGTVPFRVAAAPAPASSTSAGSPTAPASPPALFPAAPTPAPAASDGLPAAALPVAGLAAGAGLVALVLARRRTRP